MSYIVCMKRKGEENQYLYIEYPDADDSYIMPGLAVDFSPIPQWVSREQADYFDTVSEALEETQKAFQYVLKDDGVTSITILQDSSEEWEDYKTLLKKTIAFLNRELQKGD